MSKEEDDDKVVMSQWEKGSQWCYRGSEIEAR